MESSNNSVIICDSPITTVNTSARSNMVTNYRKRLRSSDVSRNLLDTPYESPLNHFKRNINPTDDDSERLGDVAVVALPLTKRQKSCPKRVGATTPSNLDESVIIVGDGESNPATRDESSDAEDNEVVELMEVSESENSTNLPGKKKAGTEIRKKGKSSLKRGKVVKKTKRKVVGSKTVGTKNRRSRKNGDPTVESSTVNDENRNGQIMESQTNESEVSTAEDVEEIEVVWSSKPNVDETASERAPTLRTKATPDMPFVVDMAPSLRNLWRDSVRKNLIKLNNCITTGDIGHAAGPENDRTSGRNPSTGRLREIVIDGSNVALGHTRNKSFSEKGLQIVLDYFKNRGHAVKVFLPQTARNRSRELIEKWHVEGIVVFTPSRKIAGRMITSYDDRYILEYATKCDGIVVSSDQYRDLWQEKPQWRNTIENRLLTPTFVGDYLMFPEDPLGRLGPKLEDFLRH